MIVHSLELHLQNTLLLLRDDIFEKSTKKVIIPTCKKIKEFNRFYFLEKKKEFKEMFSRVLRILKI